MRLITIILFILLILHGSYAPPVTQDKSKQQDSEVKDDLEEYMEYHRYLQEVVQALESDPDFRERLEKADEDDVRSGKIAEQLDFVNHNVRSKLDEIKRRELERLRHLATKQYELMNDLNSDVGPVPSNEHLDHSNPHTFEIEDLKKLIKKTTADLEVADKERKKQFKEYEMQKKFENEQKMENMDEAQKKEYADQLKKDEDAKKHHQPLHHPGSKQQLEEVWEKQDHMDQQFNPKAFFMMHDVDGNGVWDADEVKALFIKELDKLYGPGGPNKDLHERAEEMERMREHVFKENDHNHDGLIDFHEFMMETQKAEFNRDEGWKPIEENQIYTQAEYEEFERRRLEELRYLQQRGLVDAHGRPIPGAQQQIHRQAYQQQPHYQIQQQYYPQGQLQGQVPPQGYQQYQPPPQGNQAGQYQNQQMPQAQYQNQQIPQTQYQQVPQGQHPNQQVPQYQQPPPVQNSNQQTQGQLGQQPLQEQYMAPQQQQYHAPQQVPASVDKVPAQVNQGQASQTQGQAVQGQGQPLQNQPPQVQASLSQAQSSQTGQGQGQAPPVPKN